MLILQVDVYPGEHVRGRADSSRVHGGGHLRRNGPATHRHVHPRLAQGTAFLPGIFYTIFFV